MATPLSTAFGFVMTDFELIGAITRVPLARRPQVIVVTGEVLDEQDLAFVDGRAAPLLSKSGLSPRHLADSIRSLT